MQASQQASPGTGARGLSKCCSGTRLGASWEHLWFSSARPSTCAIDCASANTGPSSQLHKEGLPPLCSPQLPSWGLAHSQARGIVGGIADATQGSGGFVVRKQAWYEEEPRGWWVLCHPSPPFSFWIPEGLPLDARLSCMQFPLPGMPFPTSALVQADPLPPSGHSQY